MITTPRASRSRRTRESPSSRWSGYIDTDGHPSRSLPLLARLQHPGADRDLRGLHGSGRIPRHLREVPRGPAIDRAPRGVAAEPRDEGVRRRWLADRGVRQRAPRDHPAGACASPVHPRGPGDRGSLVLQARRDQPSPAGERGMAQPRDRQPGAGRLHDHDAALAEPVPDAREAVRAEVQGDDPGARDREDVPEGQDPRDVRQSGVLRKRRLRYRVRRPDVLRQARDGSDPARGGATGGDRAGAVQAEPACQHAGRARPPRHRAPEPRRGERHRGGRGEEGVGDRDRARSPAGSGGGGQLFHGVRAAPARAAAGDRRCVAGRLPRLHDPGPQAPADGRGSRRQAPRRDREDAWRGTRRGARTGWPPARRRSRPATAPRSSSRTTGP